MRLFTIALFLVASFVASSASAELHPHARNGFMIGFGVGGGTAGVDLTDGDDEGREGGGAGNFRVGYALRQECAIHFETSSWVKSEDNVDLTFSFFGAAGTYYVPNSGAFVRGGVGAGSSQAKVTVEVNNIDLTAEKNETGFGVLGAAGYEWRLTPKFALGPEIDFAYLAVGGDLVDSANFVNFSLQFNWYWSKATSSN